MTETTTDLWRGIHKNDLNPFETEDGPKPDVLLPTMTRKEIGNGKYRDPDVVIVDDVVQPGNGTSLFDKSPFFKGKSWGYFHIPEGTVIPPVLTVTGPSYNEYFDANHYQIEAAKPVGVESFRAALDNFARSAYAKRYVDARTPEAADKGE